MEHNEQTNKNLTKEEVKEDKKVQSENKQLKKYIKELEEENKSLKDFIGGK